MTLVRSTETAKACRPSAKALPYPPVVLRGEANLSSHSGGPLWLGLQPCDYSEAAWHSSQKVSLGIKEKRRLIVVAALNLLG